VDDGVTGQPELPKFGPVMQCGVEGEHRAAGQRLAPQQLVITAQRRTMTVRIVAAGIAADVESRVDHRSVGHAETVTAITDA